MEDFTKTSLLEALKKLCLINYYVKGWGRIRGLDCVTDNFGPERHSQCRASYSFEGKDLNGCQLSVSPSAKNKRCLQFREIKGEKFMPKKGESLKIIYKNSKGKKVVTTCYYMKGKVH